MIALVEWISLAGIAVFAISGALMALRQGLDAVGVAFIAAVTGVGGGTIRDLLLGKTPISWVVDPTPIAVCMALGLGCCFLNHRLVGRRLRGLLYADALGMAAFSVLGAQQAEMAGAHPMVSVLFGAVSACFGGIVRDVICNETPLLLRRDIYILAAMLGALVYIAIPDGLGAEPRLLGGAVAALLLRSAAIWRGWSLNFPAPRFPES